MTDRPPTTTSSEPQSVPDDSASTPNTTMSTVDESVESPPVPRSAPDNPADTVLLEAAAADSATDLARTDVTNTTLASLSGVILTVLLAAVGLTTGDGSYPPLALVAMGAAAILLAAVLVVLAAAMWPRRGGTGGVPHYATLTAAALEAELAVTTPARWYAERTVAKARIAVRRHTAQRVATTALAAAVSMLALAAILSLATG